MVHDEAFSASSVSGDDGMRWITLTGEFDLATAPNLEDELDRTATSTTNAVVLDLSRLTFMDCAGLRAIFNFSDRVRTRGWKLRIVSPPPQLSRIFGLIAGSAPRKWDPPAKERRHALRSTRARATPTA